MPNLPTHPDKYHGTPVFTASDLLAYRWRNQRGPKVQPPQTILLCYQREPFDTLRKHQRTLKVGGFFGEAYALKDKPIGVMKVVGPGAPLVAVVLEELCAGGVKRFISIGLAGGLQPDRIPGNIVVCNQAIRDEGTSYHYLPPARSVEASPALVQQVCAALSARGLPYSIGVSWTTDAPFRETCGEVERYRAEGVETVEMEAAALFAAGQRLNVETAAVMVIGDRLADLVWQPTEASAWRPSLVAVAAAVADKLSAE